MDDIDRAQEREQQHREHAIAEALRSAQPSLRPCGICFNCCSRVAPGVTFCDADCRSDYDERRRAEVRRGQ